MTCCCFHVSAYSHRVCRPVSPSLSMYSIGVRSCVGNAHYNSALKEMNEPTRAPLSGRLQALKFSAARAAGADRGELISTCQWAERWFMIDAGY